MDTKVVVITQDDWENKITLSESLEKAYSNLHYGVTKAQDVETAIWNIVNDINEGASRETTINQLKDMIKISRDIMTDIHRAQEIMGPMKRKVSP